MCTVTVNLPLNIHNNNAAYKVPDTQEHDLGYYQGIVDKCVLNGLSHSADTPTCQPEQVWVWCGVPLEIQVWVYMPREHPLHLAAVGGDGTQCRPRSGCVYLAQSL